MANRFATLEQDVAGRPLSGKPPARRRPLARAQSVPATAPSGLMAPSATKLSDALAHIATFRADSRPSRFTGLARSAVADRLEQLVRNPNLLYQDGLSVCSVAAFVRLWLARDPVAVVDCASKIFSDATTQIGSETHTIRGQLLANDYSALATRFPDISPAADWMLLCGIRDGYNWVWDAVGTPTGTLETIRDGGNSSEVESWLRATGAYSGGVDKWDSLWHLDSSSLPHFLTLRPDATHDVALGVNASNELLRQFGFTPGADASGHNFTMLSSASSSGGFTEFDAWSWGRTAHIRVEDSWITQHLGETIVCSA